MDSCEKNKECTGCSNLIKIEDKTSICKLTKFEPIELEDDEDVEENAVFILKMDDLYDMI